MIIRFFVLAAVASIAAGCAGSPNYVFGAQTRADNVKLGVTSGDGTEQGVIECDMDQQGKTYNCRRMTINYVNPERDLVLVETIETQSLIYTYQNEHVMWSCEENGDVLNCKRSCGGDTEQLCPKSAIISAKKKD